MAATGYCQLCGSLIPAYPGSVGQQAGRAGGTLLSQQFWELHHKDWPRDLKLRVCQDCYQNKPRCRICKLPMGAPSPNGVCITCQQVLNPCLSCGQKIEKRYFEFDGVGPYCENCLKKRSGCDVCAAPLTDEYWQLSDARKVCAYCHASAVYLPVTAVALYEEMKAVITQQMGLKLNVPTGLALVDRNQLSEVIRQQAAANSENGLLDNGLDPQRTLGIYARRGIRRAIYLQTGLPRMLFIQVAAHEYAHAWQGENCPLLHNALFYEGFAEWMAYHLIGFYGYNKGRERMMERNDIYGQGLKWALDIEARQGRDGVLQACRRME